jgi:hypothetical protein
MAKRKLSNTPQARWARRKKANGRCSRCGLHRERLKQLCNTCQALATAYMRQYRAAKKRENVPVGDTEIRGEGTGNITTPDNQS